MNPLHIHQQYEQAEPRTEHRHCPSISRSHTAAFDLLVGCLLMMPSGCGLCSDEIVATAVSPDGRRMATLKSRNCGATTAFFNTLDVSVPENTFQVEA
jgi:hypothetical protein